MPAVPGRDDRADDGVAVYRNQQSVPVMRDELGEAFDVVGVPGLSVCQPPKLQDGRQIASAGDTDGGNHVPNLRCGPAMFAGARDQPVPNRPQSAPQPRTAPKTRSRSVMGPGLPRCAGSRRSARRAECDSDALDAQADADDRRGSRLGPPDVSDLGQLPLAGRVTVMEG